MKQAELFNRTRSEMLKEAGITIASENHYDDLLVARAFAVKLGIQRRFVTADDVCYAMAQSGLYDLYQRLGNSRGALFRDKCWHWTGDWRKSERVYAHSNPLRVWEYTG